MKRIAHYPTALAAVLFMAVLVAGAAEADERKKPQPEEFLSITVACDAFFPEPPFFFSVSFGGSGDLTSGGGTITVGTVAISTSCVAAVAEFGQVLEGLPCDSSPVLPSGVSARLLSVCQATRAELVNVMGEVGRAVTILPAATVP